MVDKSSDDGGRLGQIPWLDAIVDVHIGVMAPGVVLDRVGYLHVFRQAMAADSADPFGLYVGTSTGQVFFSADEGDSWTVLIDCLPPIYSLSSALI